MFSKTQDAKRLFRLAPAREARSHTWSPGKAAEIEPAARPADGSFRIVTYNIHKCRGLDGRVQPQRIVNVLREVEADAAGRVLVRVWTPQAWPDVQTTLARPGGHREP